MGLFSRGLSFFRKKKTFTADEFIFKYLRSAGSNDMNVNGSITPVVFEYVIPVGKDAWIERINMSAHNANITPDTFLGLAALANGLEIKAYDDQDNLLLDFCDGEPITDVTDLANLAGIDVLIDSQGAAQDGFAVRWTLSKAGESLFMRSGSKIRVTVNDDLSTVPHFKMMLQGILVNEY